MEENTCNEATGKGLISKIYKQLMQLSNKTMNNPMKKLAKELNRHFYKEAIQVSESHEKMLNITKYQRCLNQNYNVISSHTDQNTHHQKNLPKINVGEGGEKRELFNTVFWAPKSLQMVTSAMKLKDTCSLEEKL